MLAAFDAPPRELALSERSLLRLCRFITGTVGIKMSAAKRPMLQSRLQRRLRELQLPSMEAYLDYLFDPATGSGEVTHLIDAITTNKTDFFREPHHFDQLTRVALPALDPDAAERPDESRSWKLKLWCAGCATGEEPYTLAMVLAEFAASRSGFDFSILATDVSTRVLDHARRAVYAGERIEPVAASLRARYLLRHKDPTQALVRIVPALRERVAFQRLNFMDTDYGLHHRFEVVFFRNVMIYFDKPTQEKVINRLCRHLRPGGFLFVGHSESLAGLNVPLQPVSTAVYRRV